MTICFECRHHRDINKNPMAPGVWYSQVCAAPSVGGPQAQDPVTGKWGRWAKNDLGTSYITDDPPFCRDINKGECEYFEPKGGG